MDRSALKTAKQKEHLMPQSDASPRQAKRNGPYRGTYPLARRDDFSLGKTNEPYWPWKLY
jgi:hypothetical protein